MTQAIAKPDDVAGLMPALSSEQAVGRYNEIVQFVKKVMKPNVDFGVIPGTGGKPTLLKPGAEKLCSLFGLDCMFEVADSVEDWEQGFFAYRYRAVLRRGDRIVAAAEGSCNSKETKYRWRWATMAEKPDDATAKDLKAKGLLRWRKFDGQWCACERVKNDEIFSQVNTLQKMAQKRALVASILIAANASEFFTQDIEDMGIIDVDVVEDQSAPEAPSPTPPSRDSGSSQDKPNQGDGREYAKGDSAEEAKMRDEIRVALRKATKGWSDEDKRDWLKSLTAYGDNEGFGSLNKVRRAKAGAKTGCLPILHGKINKKLLDAAAAADWLDKQNAKAVATAQDTAAEAPQGDPNDPLAPQEMLDLSDVIPF